MASEAADPQQRDRLVWLDLEMTGLDPMRHEIVEAAVAVTTAKDLIILDSVDVVIHQPRAVLETADPTAREMHQRSGLLPLIRASTTNLADAEGMLLEVVRRWCVPQTGVLAGNSIWQDRLFLARYMPEFTAFLHYRQVDVTTLKILARAWFADTGTFTKSEQSHRALDDIRQSIDELRFYRRLFGARVG